MINAIVNDIEDTFAALADPTRRRVVELLSTRPLRSSEIADLAEMSRPAMSRHLRALRASGLVHVELSDDDARARTYRLRAEGLVALHAWLDQVEAFWAAQLGAFKEHSERTRGKSR